MDELFKSSKANTSLYQIIDLNTMKKVAHLTPANPEREFALVPGVLGFTLSPECFSSAGDLSNNVRFSSKEAK